MINSIYKIVFSTENKLWGKLVSCIISYNNSEKAIIALSFEIHKLADLQKAVIAYILVSIDKKDTYNVCIITPTLVEKYIAFNCEAFLLPYLFRRSLPCYSSLFLYKTLDRSFRLSLVLGEKL